MGKPVKLTDRQARVLARALAYNRLQDDVQSDWEDYPYLDEDSRSLVAEYIEFLGKRILEEAYEMVDDIDEVDELLQRAEFGANDG